MPTVTAEVITEPEVLTIGMMRSISDTTDVLIDTAVVETIVPQRTESTIPMGAASADPRESVIALSELVYRAVANTDPAIPVCIVAVQEPVAFGVVGVGKSVKLRMSY